MLVSSIFPFSNSFQKTSFSGIAWERYLHGYACLIDQLVFNAVFNIFSVISRWLVHLSILFWSSFYQYHANILSKSLATFPHNDTHQWKRNEFCCIISPWKEYWPSLGTFSYSQVLYITDLAMGARHHRHAKKGIKKTHFIYIVYFKC